MEATRLNKVGIEEYLSIEAAATEKYEYHDGYIYSMAGGTFNHGMICGNIFGELRSGLKDSGSDCKAMSSEMKLHVAAQNSFLYPDSMVVCDDIEKSKVDPNSVTNPKVIVEVLSKSTSSYDRGDKFYTYRQIPSLKEYILIEQSKAQIEIYTREYDLWKITRVSGLEVELYISSIGLKIQLSDIYDGVEF